MRFAVDTGGTFTDLVIEDDAGTLRMFKAPTTPQDPVEGKGRFKETYGFTRLHKGANDDVQNVVGTIPADDLTRREPIKRSQFFPEF